MIEDLIDLYTRLGKGVYNEEFRNKTKAVINHLIDNGFSKKHIVRVINEVKKRDYMIPQDLPNFLWEGSLLKRDTFYYNSILQIVSSPPKWNPETMQQVSEPFFLEMKIMYTIDDLLNYYYDELQINISFRDENKDKGALQYLLNKYKIDNIESIDVVLLLIENAKACLSKSFSIITNPLKLQDFEGDVITFLNNVIPNKVAKRTNKIIWRTYNE